MTDEKTIQPSPFCPPLTAPTAKGRERMTELLTHAIDTFIELGYERASLEKIIRKSGGSRSTVYQCYGNKEGLFIAALQMMADDIYAAYLEQYSHERSLREELCAFGTLFLTKMLSPRAVGASRLIMAETPRLPEIGRWFYRDGIAMSYECFAKVLENHIDAPLPELTDLASRYIEMLKGPLFMRALCVPEKPVTREEIAHEVDAAASLVMTYIHSVYGSRLRQAPPAAD